MRSRGFFAGFRISSWRGIRFRRRWSSSAGWRVFRYGRAVAYLEIRMRVLLAAIGVGLVIGACTAEGTKSVQTTPDCTLPGPTVSPPSATMHVGDSLRASASFQPCPPDAGAATFQWRSSNTSVAIVDSIAGLVRAIDTGSTSIIATATENRALVGAMALKVAP